MEDTNHEPNVPDRPGAARGGVRLAGRPGVAAARGEQVTVFDLALNYLDAGDARRDGTGAGRFTPLAVRVVVNEASGDATLTSRR